MDQVVQVGVRAEWPLWCSSIHECMLSRPDGAIRRVSSPLAAASREPHHDLEGADGGDIRGGQPRPSGAVAPRPVSSLCHARPAG